MGAVTQVCSVKSCSWEFREIQDVGLQLSFNSFMTEVGIMYKPVHWFAPPSWKSEERLWHMSSSVNFKKLLRIPFFIEHLRWLLFASEKKKKKKRKEKKKKIEIVLDILDFEWISDFDGLAKFIHYLIMILELTLDK